MSGIVVAHSLWNSGRSQSENWSLSFWNSGRSQFLKTVVAHSFWNSGRSQSLETGRSKFLETVVAHSLWKQWSLTVSGNSGRSQSPVSGRSVSENSGRSQFLEQWSLTVSGIVVAQSFLKLVAQSPVLAHSLWQQWSLSTQFLETGCSVSSGRPQSLETGRSQFLETGRSVSSGRSVSGIVVAHSFWKLVAQSPVVAQSLETGRSVSSGRSVSGNWSLTVSGNWSLCL